MRIDIYQSTQSLVRRLLATEKGKTKVNIPVKALKEISQKYGYDHIICFATKGKMQYVATYGTTIQACDEAAQFGDKMKDGLGWPESLHAAPSRERALQKRVKELEAQLQAAEHGVQATRLSPSNSQVLGDNPPSA